MEEERFKISKESIRFSQKGLKEKEESRRSPRLDEDIQGYYG